MFNWITLIDNINEHWRILYIHSKNVECGQTQTLG